MDGEAVVVDGSNVAWETLSPEGKPRASNIIAVKQALEALEFEPVILVDAALRYQVEDPHLVEQLIRDQTVRQVPANTDGDLWVLQAAEAQGAYFLSNDLYKEYWERYSWLDERRIRFMLVGGRVLLHGQAVAAHQVPAEPAGDSGARPAPDPDVAAGQALREQLRRENSALRGQRELLAGQYERLRTENERLRAEVAQAVSLDQSYRDLQRRVADDAALVERARRDVEDVDRREGRYQALVETLAHEREVVASLSRQVETLTDELAAVRRADAEHQRQRDAARERADKLAQQVEVLGKRFPGRSAEPHPELLRLLNEILRNLNGAGLPPELVAPGKPKGGALPVPIDGGDIPANGTSPGETDNSDERKWLAGWDGGNDHSRAYFKLAAETLRSNPELGDDERLLREIRALRRSVGPFDYCQLFAALQGIRKPSAKNNVLQVRLRDSIRYVPCDAIERPAGAPEPSSVRSIQEGEPAP